MQNEEHNCSDIYKNDLLFMMMSVAIVSIALGALLFYLTQTLTAFLEFVEICIA